MTQTVGDLLNQFNLQLDLKPEVLDLKIPGEYTSFRKKGVELRFNNYNKGFVDYDLFECYIFARNNCTVLIAPDCNLEHVSFSEKLDSGRVTGYSFDEFGNVSVRA